MDNSTLTPLLEEITALYDGDLKLAINRMDEILFMLFYVDQEVINFQRIQDTAYEIKYLREGLKKSLDLQEAQTQGPQQAPQQKPVVKYVPLGMIGEA